jgi:uncharacterized membrane protein YfhO
LPIVRVNHALRGVVLPAGSGEIQMRYEPASFALGVKLAAAAAMALVLWSIGAAIGKRSRPSLAVG